MLNALLPAPITTFALGLIMSPMHKSKTYSLYSNWSDQPSHIYACSEYLTHAARLRLFLTRILPTPLPAENCCSRLHSRISIISTLPPHITLVRPLPFVIFKSSPFRPLCMRGNHGNFDRFFITAGQKREILTPVNSIRPETHIRQDNIPPL